MKKIISLTICSIIMSSAHAVDKTLLLNAKAPYLSENDFKREMQDLADMRVLFKKDQEQRLKFYVNSMMVLDLQNQLSSMLGGIANPVNFVFSLGTQVMERRNELSRDNHENAAEYFYEIASNHVLYVLYKKDKQHFERVVRIPDDVERAREIYREIEALEAFADFKTDDAELRGVLNSRAIIKLIDITKKLASQTVINSEDIRDLKKDSAHFKKILKKNFGITLELVKNDAAQQESILGITDEVQKLNEQFKEVSQSPGQKIDGSKLKDIAQNIADKGADYIRYADRSIAIMQDLGLSDKDAAEAKKYLSHLSTAVSISKIYASGGAGTPDDYLNAIQGVTSIFSKKKPSDPATQRHEQVIKILGQVMENQRKILEGIKAIYELQKLTYDTVLSMYEYNIKSFNRLNDKVDSLLIGQAAILKSIESYSEVNRQINSCYDFFTTRYYCPDNSKPDKCFNHLITKEQTKDYHQNFNPDQISLSSVMINGRFKDYEFQKYHAEMNQNFEKFKECKRAMEHVFNPQVTSSFFLTQTYVNELSNRTNIEMFLKDGYLDLYNFVGPALFYNDLTASSFYFAGNLPSSDYRISSFKTTNTLSYFKKNRIQSLNKSKVQSSLILHLSTPALERYISYLLELSQYDGLIHPSGTRLLTKQELLNIEDTDLSPGLQVRFKKAVELVNVAISQQTMMAGDGILDYVVNKFLREEQKTAGRDQIIKILSANPYLAQNFFMRLFSSRVRSYVTSDSILPLKQLDSFLKNETEMNKIFSDVGIISDGLITVAGKDLSYAFRIPSAKDIKEAKFQHTPELFRLIDLRGKIYEKVLNFEGAKESVIDQNDFVPPIP